MSIVSSHLTLLPKGIVVRHLCRTNSIYQILHGK
ncbi:hypothetical protein [Shigella phage ESh30]|nr:hypothetical protein [Shigella phage ESh30]